MAADPTTERTEGPTPHGGAYALVTWLDDDWNIVPRSKATGGEIVEFDASGNQVFRTYMRTAPAPKEEP